MMEGISNEVAEDYEKKISETTGELSQLTGQIEKYKKSLGILKEEYV